MLGIPLKSTLNLCSEAHLEADCLEAEHCLEAEQCNYLMIWVGKTGREIYKTFALTDEEKSELKTLYEKFDVYVKPKSNQVFARYLFHAKVQDEGETFENFVTELKLLARDCGYQEAEEMVRDRIVFGIKSAKVRARLIQEGSSLTLDKAIDIGRTMELSDAQLKTMTGDDMKVHGLNQQSGKDRQRKKRFEGHRKPGQPCGKCGYNHQEGKCPTKGKQCNKCHKYNHFAKMCKSVAGSTRKGTKVHGVDLEDQSSDDDFMFIGCVESTINAVNMKSNEWYETLTINNKSVKFQLDTGARCNTIPTTVYRDLGLAQKLTKSDTPLKSYSGHPIVVQGTVVLPVSYKGQTFRVKFYIVDVKASPVLSAETCKELNLVKRVHEISQQNINKQFSNKLIDIKND